MSDAGLYTEDWLMKNVPHELPSDILIKGAPRHGPSGDSAFLGAVKPRAVIATGADFPGTEKIPDKFAKDLRNHGHPTLRAGPLRRRGDPNLFQSLGGLGIRRQTTILSLR